MNPAALRLGLWWIRSLKPHFPEKPDLPETGILALWHEHMLPCLSAFAGRGMRVLVSQSRDGDIGALACERLGYSAVRGSSSRGGAAALKTLARALSTRGGWVALIVDGPRGPRRKSKPGAVWLSEKTGIPVTAVAAKAVPALRAGNWDRTAIPLPFARVRLRLAPPFFPASAEELDKAMHALAS